MFFYIRTISRDCENYFAVVSSNIYPLCSNNYWVPRLHLASNTYKDNLLNNFYMKTFNIWEGHKEKVYNNYALYLEES